MLCSGSVYPRDVYIDFGFQQNVLDLRNLGRGPFLINELNHPLQDGNLIRLHSRLTRSLPTAPMATPLHRHQSSLEGFIDLSPLSPLKPDLRSEGTILFNRIISYYEPSQSEGPYSASRTSMPSPKITS